MATILYDPKKEDAASIATFIDNCSKMAVLVGAEEIVVPFTEGQRQAVIVALRSHEPSEEHYQAAMAMAEKHRKNWVAACQQRDKLKSDMDKIVRFRDSLDAEPV